LSYESLTSFEASQALHDLPVSDPEFYTELVGQQSQQLAPTLSSEDAETKDLEGNHLSVFGDDSKVLLKELLRNHPLKTLTTPM